MRKRHFSYVSVSCLSLVNFNLKTEQIKRNTFKLHLLPFSCSRLSWYVAPRRPKFEWSWMTTLTASSTHAVVLWKSKTTENVNPRKMHLPKLGNCLLEFLCEPDVNSFVHLPYQENSSRFIDP
jgi:hypothetical protein